MFQRAHWIRIGLLLVGLAIVLGGCFSGGSSPKKKDPAPTPTAMHGQVVGPSGAVVSSQINVFGSRARAATGRLEGEAAVANVSVLVYVLGDYVRDPGTAPIAQTTTDGEGKYSVTNVPSGKDLLLIAGSTPRLSAILPRADKDTPGNVNSTTSLAAEAWVERMRDDASIVIDDDAFQRTLDAARDGLQTLGGSELLDAMHALIPAKVGDGWSAQLPPQFQSIAEGVADSIPEGPQACWHVQLLNFTGLPSAFLSLDGISPDWMDEDTYARFEVEGMDELVPVYIELLGGDEAEFIVPLHPGDVWGGGIGQLVIYNEAYDVVCPPMPLTVEPLTPAPAHMELSTMLDKLEQSFTARASALGFSKNELLNLDLTQMSNPASDPSARLVAGLAAGLQMLEGDNGSGNLRDALTGSLRVKDETLEFDLDDLRLVEALAYANGFSQDLLSFLDEFPEVVVPSAGGGTQGMERMAMQPLQGGLLPPLPHNITTPAELDYWMEARTHCTIWNNAWLRAPREIAGGMAGAVSLVPGTQIATGPFLAFLTVSQMAIDICSNLLPHRFATFDVIADPGVHNEDGDPEGTWEASFTAVGEQWTLDWPTVIGAVPGVGKAGKVITKVAQQFGSNWHRAEPLLGWLQGILLDVWGIHADSGLYTFEPFDPQPIVVDPRRPGEEEYIRWTIEPDDGTFVFTSDETGYVAKDVGDGQIWVRTQADKFQGEFAGGHALLEVKPIEIEIASYDLPGPPFYVEPGEDLGLVAHVMNADDPTVEWWTDGRGSIERTEGASGEQLATYTAPMEPGQYWVEAESMSRTGLRESGIPERRARAEIIVGGLLLSPGAACVEVGESLPLRVTYSFGGDVDWADLEVMVSGSDAGYVENGVFHAVREGEAIVSVWDRDFPDMAADAVFTVSDECDGFVLTAMGSHDFSFEGSCTLYFGNRVYMTDRGNNEIQFHVPQDAVEDLEEGIAEFVTFETNVAVSYPAIPTYSQFGWSSVYFGEGELSPVTMWGYWVEYDFYVPEIDETITDHIFFLSGSVEGPLVSLDQEGNKVVVQTSIEFRGVTDGWGRDWGYWGHRMSEVCDVAGPLG